MALVPWLLTTRRLYDYHEEPFTMGEDMNTTTTAETATTAATAPLDPDPDTIKMFVGQDTIRIEYVQLVFFVEQRRDCGRPYRWTNRFENEDKIIK
ncbi:hypothetical protein ANCCEY_03839 [Ancylostoma ceylanicum]|uniref:Uncharacterized protein n=1 Tax=Ancylostoma ceylanicum TaxID=53326 RepID=A0A0D6M0T1_9BILA|nr:hypothetical protein ANCCEY_03839 [Ancylostoma ceylanicum]